MCVKKSIINKVNSIDNPEVLSNILELISTESEIEDIYQFTISEKTSVLEGIKDADNGNSYDKQESDKIISKWIGEKSDGLLGH